ncbi:hypothetical protein OE88DRAFT_610954 [Heliocybe sulcata]|uniref:Ubiquitin-like domain-containing protein n=1 Tax=Heliocybe sulcata TaxID=5364 RepID=A0A5C3NDH3_9AGAM|nr:hypothetical protein OE88DRAFT_610954 [Heliocybe sulcata]
MQLTFVNDLGQTYGVEIDPTMELENVMALLEAESGVPADEQSIYYENRELTNGKATMQDLGVGENAMLLLRRKVRAAGRDIPQDAEMMRLQLLGDPQMMQQIRQASCLTAFASDGPNRSLVKPRAGCGC